MVQKRLIALVLVLFGSIPLLSAVPGQRSVPWGGLTWDVASQVPLGEPTPGRVEAAAENVLFAPDGSLQLKLAAGPRGYTGARVLADVGAGFGTYTWVLEGPLDSLESSVVLDLFTGGRGRADQTGGPNECHIRFTRWSSEVPGDNIEFAVYPPLGSEDPNPVPSYEGGMLLNLKGSNKVTMVLEWDPDRMDFRALDAKGKLIRHQLFVPEEPLETIPQAPGAIGIQLWSYGQKPTHDLEVVIRDFRYVPRP